MQYEIVIKSDRWCSCYTCLPCTAPAAQTALKKDLGTGTDAPPVAQRLLTNTRPKTRQPNKHTCKQRLTLRNSTTIYKKTANKTKLELFYALQRSRGHKERLKRS